MDPYPTGSMRTNKKEKKIGKKREGGEGRGKGSVAEGDAGNGHRWAVGTRSEGLPPNHDQERYREMGEKKKREGKSSVRRSKGLRLAVMIVG